MNRKLQVTLLATGSKGLGLLQGLEPNQGLARVLTYEHPAGGEAATSLFATECERLGVPLRIVHRIGASDVYGSDAVVAVGWQYLFGDLGCPTFVFHDSLLPRHRGFAPTVSALIAGDPHIGVTALIPTDGMDAGPIVGQQSVAVKHPVRIAEAFEALKGPYLELFLDLLAMLRRGEVRARQQDHSQASYSIWRDAADYVVDWSWPSDRIARFVLAVGPPYDGAQTTVDGLEIRIGHAEEIEDVPFVHRHPGKLWRRDADGADVVCGQGMIRIRDLRTATGHRFTFNALRIRLGCAR